MDLLTVDTQMLFGVGEQGCANSLCNFINSRPTFSVLYRTPPQPIPMMQCKALQLNLAAAVILVYHCVMVGRVRGGRLISPTCVS